uniref:Uncharacterized protein n=1 Tax=Anguilla anguilla TaxID=7936 RepID=A0A0E9TEC9_ANGAN
MVDRFQSFYFICHFPLKIVKKVLSMQKVVLHGACKEYMTEQGSDHQ